MRFGRFGEGRFGRFGEERGGYEVWTLRTHLSKCSILHFAPFSSIPRTSKKYQ
jgi:hypothetical protein